MTAEVKRRWFVVPITELAVMVALLVGLVVGAALTWQKVLPNYIGPGADHAMLALDLGTARDWSLAASTTYIVRFQRNDDGRIEGYVIEGQLRQAGPPVQLIQRRISDDVDVTCSRLIVEFIAGNKVANAATLEISNRRSHQRWKIEIDSPQAGIVLQRA
jgi:hypothetical protein